MFAYGVEGADAPIMMVSSLVAFAKFATIPCLFSFWSVVMISRSKQRRPLSKLGCMVSGATILGFPTFGLCSRAHFFAARTAKKLLSVPPEMKFSLKFFSGWIGLTPMTRRSHLIFCL